MLGNLDRGETPNVLHLIRGNQIVATTNQFPATQCAMAEFMEGHAVASDGNLSYASSARSSAIFGIALSRYMLTICFCNIFVYYVRYLLHLELYELL